jgi:hypothetical protein
MDALLVGKGFGTEALRRGRRRRAPVDRHTAEIHVQAIFDLSTHGFFRSHRLSLGLERRRNNGAEQGQRSGHHDRLVRQSW